METKPDAQIARETLLEIIAECRKIVQESGRGPHDTLAALKQMESAASLLVGLRRME